MRGQESGFDRQAFERAVAWFVALRDDNCDERKRARFQRWLAMHPSHPVAYAEAEKLWSSLDGIKSTTIPGLDAARTARPQRWSAARGGIATLLLMAVVAGWWLDYSADTLHYSTGLGQRRGIELADGSHVELNAMTQLSVRMSWLRREVVLEEGQAMFDVVHRRFPDFAVQSGNLRIRDIGTRFDVRKRPEGMVVAVLDGEVELTQGDARLGDRLTAGFSRRTDSHGRLRVAERFDPEQAGAWIGGRLVFEHTPLADVVAELQRHHPVHFRFAEPALAGETLSGTFDAADLNPFLRALEKILPIHAQRQKQTVVLSRR